MIDRSGGDGVTEHTDVGAYALGLLEEDDRRAFAAHLAGCDRCTRELAEFSGLRELLADLGPVTSEAEDMPPPASPSGTGDVAGLLRRRRAAARRQRRGTAFLGLVAGVALLAGGITAGAAVTASHSGHGHGDVPADLLVWGDTRGATDHGTGVAGVVAMENKGWGTHVALDLTHLTGPRTCELVAYSRSGAAHVVTEWAVPPGGYGEPGAPGHLQIHGGTALRRTELQRFEVRDQGGGTLLTIPV